MKLLATSPYFWTFGLSCQKHSLLSREKAIARCKYCLGNVPETIKTRINRYDIMHNPYIYNCLG